MVEIKFVDGIPCIVIPVDYLYEDNEKSADFSQIQELKEKKYRRMILAELKERFKEK